MASVNVDAIFTEWTLKCTAIGAYALLTKLNMTIAFFFVNQTSTGFHFHMTGYS